MYVGLAIMSVYAAAISAPLLGEAYQKGVNKLAETTSA
jgi:hypothetical protein